MGAPSFNQSVNEPLHTFPSTRSLIQRDLASLHQRTMKRHVTISIFRYCPDKRQFTKSFDVNGASSDSVVPSEVWLEEYKKWNVFGGVVHPRFHDLSHLHYFNRKGLELSLRLQDELGDNVTVLPFLPIYRNVQVGGMECGWWHLKDMNYGFPVNIQKLPLSDSLKGEFMGWFRKLEGWEWINPEIQDEINDEGRVLQRKLLQELRPSDQGMKVARRTVKCDHALAEFSAGEY